MKKVLFLFVVGLSLCSCTSVGYVVSYDLGLKNVEKSKDDEPVKVIETSIDGSTYSDSILNIKWGVNTTSLIFNIENKTNSSLTLDWNGVSYIGNTGQNEKIMHTGVKFIERNNSVPPTIIMKRSNFSDEITPTSNVRWVDGSKYSVGGWVTDPLVLNHSSDSIMADAISNVYSRQLCKVRLPIIHKNNNLEYVFTFNTVNNKVTKTDLYDQEKSMLAAFTFPLLGSLLLMLLIL